MNKRKQLLNFSDLMQKKQPPKELPPSSQNIMATILQSMPKEASITKIEYEINCRLVQILLDIS